MVRVRIVVSCSAEDVDPDVSFFKLLGPPLERSLNYMFEKTGIAPIVPENVAGEDSIELFANRVALGQASAPTPCVLDRVEGRLSVLDLPWRTPFRLARTISRA